MRPLFLIVAVGFVVLHLPAKGAELAAAETNALPAEVMAQIDANVKEVMEESGVPSVSIAVVREGKVIYLRAYGNARVATGVKGEGTKDVPATTETRYGIGSVSKQFTAAAILLLAQEGKLSLDDPVGRYIGGLTRGDKITIRQVLNHTSGYRDFWPQNYVVPAMLKPATPQEIAGTWGRGDLDFEPGGQKGYANTNYTIAGLIVEKASGMPLMDFLKKRIFAPLHMERVEECDSKPLHAPDAAGYVCVATGPLRPAPKEAKGWLFAMGELAMTPRELALWDISMMDRTLLAAKSYEEMLHGVTTADGKYSYYGLGVGVGLSGGSRWIGHSGEISGFLTVNCVWPLERTAIVVMTNKDGTSAHYAILRRLTQLFSLPAGLSGGTSVPVIPALYSALEGKSPAERAINEEARLFFTGLQQGKADISKLSGNAKGYFTPQALKDAAQGLGPLGAVQEFLPGNVRVKKAMTYRYYIVVCEHGTVEVNAFTLPDGRVEQFLVGPVVR